MRKVWMVFLVLILVVSFLTGCGGAQQPVDTDQGRTAPTASVSESDVSSAPWQVSFWERHKEELSVNQQENMSLEDIRRFILAIYAPVEQPGEVEPGDFKFDRSDFPLIGTINGVHVLEPFNGFETMDEAMRFCVDYYSRQGFEKHLLWRLRVNLNGRIGRLVVNEHEVPFYEIDRDRSQFILLEDGKEHKEVDVTVFGGLGENDLKDKVRFVLDRVKGRWLITDISGFYPSLEDFLKNPKIETFITDWDTTSTSPNLEKTVIGSGTIYYHHPSWVAKAVGGGIGEWIRIESQEGKEVSGIELKNGYEFSDMRYPEYNRVKRVRVELSDGSVFERNLKDGQYYQAQKVDFGQRIKTNYVKITILGVYKGSEFDDTTYISEVRVY
ncbi:MAG: hypothetical protein HPY50_04690 [Firmicutes bacterium]|nr:hypothetical protein [Bacillota bacterium]